MSHPPTMQEVEGVIDERARRARRPSAAWVCAKLGKPASSTPQSSPSMIGGLHVQVRESPRRRPDIWPSSRARCGSAAERGRCRYGPTLKDRGLISARCCSATTPTTASSSMPAASETAMSSRFSPICGGDSGPVSPQELALERPTAAFNALRIAARPLARPLGRAEAGRRDHLFDLDG